MLPLVVKLLITTSLLESFTSAFVLNLIAPPPIFDKLVCVPYAADKNPLRALPTVIFAHVISSVTSTSPSTNNALLEESLFLMSRFP